MQVHTHTVVWRGGNFPLAEKMATTINLQELEAFFLSLKEECCESVLEISLKCVEALKGSGFVEVVAFNQVRRPPSLAAVATCTNVQAD